MTIDLSKVSFINDFFSLDMPSGNLLILNKINENLLVKGEESSIQGINVIVVVYPTGESVKCPSVIGVSNEYLSITSDYPEYLGKVLTEETMKYSYIILPEVA